MKCKDECGRVLRTLVGSWLRFSRMQSAAMLQDAGRGSVRKGGVR